jgi:hypothetical protein
MSARTEVIETTVSKVGGELARRGLDPDDRVTITIEPDELIPGRRASRARVIAAGLTDDDIHRLIKQAQKEVEPPRVGEGRSRYQCSCQRRAQTTIHAGNGGARGRAARRAAQIARDRRTALRSRCLAVRYLPRRRPG